MKPVDRDRWIQALLRSDLADSVKVVAVRVALHLNFTTDQCDPSIPTIAAGVGRDQHRAIYSAISRLVAAGWITRHSTRGRHSNAYQLSSPNWVGGGPNSPHSHACRPTLHADAGSTLHADAPLGDPNPARGCTPTLHLDAVRTLHAGAPKQRKRENNEKNNEESLSGELLPHDGFDAWWSVYPKKVDREAARRTYAKVIKSAKVTEADLLAGAERYAEETRDRERRWIKNPQTWLNAGSWLDEPPSPKDRQSQQNRAGDRPHWSEGLASYSDGDEL